MKPLKNEVIDQSLHFAIGALAVASVDVIGADVPPLAGAVLGLLLGVVREFTEDKFKGAGWGTVRDLIFWTFGGMFGGAIL